MGYQKNLKKRPGVRVQVPNFRYAQHKDCVSDLAYFLTNTPQNDTILGHQLAEWRKLTHLTLAGDEPSEKATHRSSKANHQRAQGGARADQERQVPHPLQLKEKPR